VVEGTSLENWHTRKGIEGSNPSLSVRHQRGSSDRGLPRFAARPPAIGSSRERGPRVSFPSRAAGAASRSPIDLESLPSWRRHLSPESSLGYLAAHLLEGEEIVYRARLHWILFRWPIAISVLSITALIFLGQRPPDADGPVFWVACLALLGLAAVLAIGPGIRYMSSEFAVTNVRVLVKLGFVQRESTETLLSKVEAIGVDQNFAGRLFDYGTITVTGTGGTREAFATIADPLEFRRQVQSQIVKLEERRSRPSLGGEARSLPSPRARVERDCPYCAEPVLARASVCKHCGRDIVPVG
jgi:hypothetical protein